MMRKPVRQRICSTPQVSAVTRAVKSHFHSQRRQLLATAALGGVMAMPISTVAQEGALEEIIVTATKREQSMQEVPIAIIALSGETLHEQGIVRFTDYALALPNVAFKSFGYPGSATMFMRGAADGGDGNASGSMPSVCLYMDEQPVTDIAANLDVHIYDVNRIEALAGPQGTLYGASCQSGSLRIITNQPDSSQFSAGFDIGGYGTNGGDPSSSIEGFVNFPLGDSAALRLVGWSIDEGGWIDNVPGGLRTYVINGGRPDATLTNDEFVGENINELTKVGARAALGIDLGDNWTVTAGLLYQDLETDGIWEHDNFNFNKPGQIQRFNADSSNDEFSQLSLTVDGDFANHNLVYAGSFLDRDTQYLSDYSAYGDYITWVDYYACDWTYSATDCTSLNEIASRDNEYKRSTHELRLLSMGDGRLHYTAGLFFQQNEHVYLQQWIQPEMAATVAVRPSTDVYFRTDQTRELDQTAVFGEITYEFTDTFSGTLGARWFDEESTLSGVVGWGPYAFDPNWPPGADDYLDTPVDSKISNSDTIFKVNLTWNTSDNTMVYFTWSEGYRPGGINRDPGLPASALTWIPDVLTNIELGWKTTSADGRIRFNGAIYTMDWDDIQYTVYDPQLSFCCGSTYNLSTAQITGFEADATFQASDSWLVSFSLALNDAETTGDFILPNGLLSVPSGTPLPNVPDMKITAFARYDFDLGNLGAYAQIAYSYTGSSISEITQPDLRGRFDDDLGVWQQQAYAITNFRTGIDQDSWGVDIFIDNLINEVADFYVHPRPYAPSTVTNRPRSAGARLWMRF